MSEVAYKSLDFLGFPKHRIGNDGSFWKFLKKRKCWKKYKGIPSRGYLMAGFGVGYKRYYIHRLVLLAFVGPCPPGMECCHIDGNPINNRLSNLRWGTRRENMEDRVRHGCDNGGIRNGMSRLTVADVVEIRNKPVHVSPAEWYAFMAKKHKVHYDHVRKLYYGQGWSNAK